MITILHLSNFCFASLLPFSLSYLSKTNSPCSPLLNIHLEHYCEVFLPDTNNSVTPAGCLLIWFNSDLSAWIASDSQVKGRCRDQTVLWARCRLGRCEATKIRGHSFMYTEPSPPWLLHLTLTTPLAERVSRYCLFFVPSLVFITYTTIQHTLICSFIGGFPLKQLLQRGDFCSSLSKLIT